MDSQYWTVTVKFERRNMTRATHDIEHSERQSELWAASKDDALKMYKAIFYDNEPTLIMGSEKFKVAKGRHIGK